MFRDVDAASDAGRSGFAALFDAIPSDRDRERPVVFALRRLDRASSEFAAQLAAAAARAASPDGPDGDAVTPLGALLNSPPVVSHRERTIIPVRDPGAAVADVVQKLEARGFHRGGGGMLVASGRSNSDFTAFDPGTHAVLVRAMPRDVVIDSYVEPFAYGDGGTTPAGFESRATAALAEGETDPTPRSLDASHSVEGYGSPGDVRDVALLGSMSIVAFESPRALSRDITLERFVRWAAAQIHVARGIEPFQRADFALDLAGLPHGVSMHGIVGDRAELRPHGTPGTLGAEPAGASSWLNVSCEWAAGWPQRGPAVTPPLVDPRRADEPHRRHDLEGIESFYYIGFGVATLLPVELASQPSSMLTRMVDFAPGPLLGASAAARARAERCGTATFPRDGGMPATVEYAVLRAGTSEDDARCLWSGSGTAPCSQAVAVDAVHSVPRGFARVDRVGARFVVVHAARRDTLDAARFVPSARGPDVAHFHDDGFGGLMTLLPALAMIGTESHDAYDTEVSVDEAGYAITARPEARP